MREQAGASDCDDFVDIVVEIADAEVERVDAVGLDADAADHIAVLVERQAAGIGRQTQRRALRTNGRTLFSADSGAKGFEPHREVRARKLRELDAEQRPAGRIGLARVEMFLNDLARGARREGVAARRQIGAGDRLGDRRQLGRRGSGQGGVGAGEDILNVLEAVARGDTAARRHRHTRRRVGHPEDAEHIADAVDHRDHRRPAPRVGFPPRGRNGARDIGRGQVLCGGGGRPQRQRREARDQKRPHRARHPAHCPTVSGMMPKRPYFSMPPLR